MSRHPPRRDCHCHGDYRDNDARSTLYDPYNDYRRYTSRGRQANPLQEADSSSGDDIDACSNVAVRQGYDTDCSQRRDSHCQMIAVLERSFQHRPPRRQSFSDRHRWPAVGFVVGGCGGPRTTREVSRSQTTQSKLGAEQAEVRWQS